MHLRLPHWVVLVATWAYMYTAHLIRALLPGGWCRTIQEAEAGGCSLD